MKYFVYALAFAVGFYAVRALSNEGVTASTGAKAVAAKPATVLLEKKNTMSLRLPVTSSSVKELQQKILALSSALPKNEPIYLFFDTPGGSIVAGEEFITTAKGLANEVKTVTNFAASMGFIFAQSLGERLILPNGTLMSHRAYIGMEGQIPGEFNTRAKYWGDRVTSIEAVMANRLGSTLTDYQRLIKDEYWVGGHDAVAQKAADRVVYVACAADLRGTSTETLQTIFGGIEVTWSDCPLITTPIEVNFAGIYGASTEDMDKVKRLTHEVLFNKRALLHDTSMREAFFRYVK